MKIAGRTIAHDAPTFIVAELSANHGHSLETALKTVDAAADAGADAIKLQTYTPDTLTLPIDKDPFIVKSDNVWSGKSLHQLYAEAMTPWEWTDALKARAKERGLAFFSTPFDASAVDFLVASGVDAMKVASFELSDLPLVEYVARQKLPIILSTGMATLAEIRRAVGVCRDAGNGDVALLRCVSTYPANPEDMQLESLSVLASLGVTIGLSDHTRDHVTAQAAVALGARIVEKHFILDRAIGGPDAFFSLEPHELRGLVEAVRATERTLGVRFGPTANERSSLVFRRSLFVTRDVAAGEVLTCENVRSVRPGHGLPAWKLPEVLGRVAATPIAAGTPLADAHLAPPVTVALPEVVVADAAHRAEVAAWGGVYGARGGTVPELLRLVRDDTVLAAFFIDGDGLVTFALAPEQLGKDVLPRVMSAIEAYAKKTGHKALRVAAPTPEAEHALALCGFYAFRRGFGERRIAAYEEAT